MWNLKNTVNIKILQIEQKTFIKGGLHKVLISKSTLENVL